MKVGPMIAFPRVLAAGAIAAILLLVAGCGDGPTARDGDAADTTDGEGTSDPTAGAPQGVTANEIRIGSFGPVTGPASFIGTAARDGMALAFEEINAAGGVNGRELNLVFQGAEEPADSVSTAIKLVEQDGVYALVLGSGSTGAAAVADYVREKEIPTYNIVGATPVIREPFAGNVFHGVAPPAAWAARATAEMIAEAESGPSRLAVLSGTFEYADATRDAVLPELEEQGLEVVVDLTFDLGDDDFTSQITQIEGSGAEAVLQITHPLEGQRFIRQARSLGVEVPIFVDQAAVTFELLAAEDAVEGATGLLIIPYFFGSDAEAMQEFEARFEERYPDAPPLRPNYIDVIGYGDGYVLAKVIEEAGDDLSWENLISVWKQQTDVVPSQLGGVDVIFPESFSDTDHQGNNQVGVMQVQDGQWVQIDTITIERDAG